MVSKRRLFRKGCSKYAGRTMWCAPGVHEAVEVIVKTVLPLQASILDLGAGSGALLNRFQRAGFSKLHGCDICLEQCNLPGVKLSKSNLNESFASLFDQTFDLVTAIEVIEHTESPRHVLRELYSLVRPGGYLLLSTPNIAHWLGRLQFLFTGRIWYFSEKIYYEQRHISILPFNHISLMFQETGFEIVSVQGVGTFWTAFSRIVMWPVSFLARVLFGRNANGDVLLILAKRTTPNYTPPGSNADYARWYLGDQQRP